MDQIKKQLLNRQKNKKLNKDAFRQVLLATDSLPLSKEPSRTVSIVDLVSGKFKGSVNVGESVDSNNKAYESSIIFGGLGSPTPQGNTMLTGTVNPSAYYLSLSDTRIINTLKLKRPGSVNPFLTNIKEVLQYKHNH